MEKILFICGVPRSGTTYAQRLIVNNFMCMTGQESSVIDGYLSPLVARIKSDKSEERGNLGLSAYFKKDELDNILKEMMVNILNKMSLSLNTFYKNKPSLMVEKTPSNVLFVDDIIKYIDNSKILIIERDTNDILKSLIRARSAWGNDWVPKKTRHLLKLIELHKHSIEKARNIKSDKIMMYSFNKMKDDNETFIREVSYFLDEQMLCISGSNENNLSTKKTNIPVMIEDKWELHEENNDFIFNNRKLSLLEKLEILIISSLLHWKGFK